MKVSVSIFLFFITNYSLGQDYLFFYKKQIIETYEELRSTDTSYAIDIQKFESKLVVNIFGFEEINVSYYFDEDTICNYLVIEYFCNDCLPIHISELLTVRKMRWKRISDDYYLSSWGMKRTLRITRHIGAELAGIIEIKAINTRAEYDELKQLLTPHKK